MAQLRAGLEHALRGSGKAFLLQGEPGIGKTRLAEEIVTEAHERGTTVFWGRCTHAEGAPPYWPWVQILRSLVRDLGTADLERRAGPGLAQILLIVPELRIHYGEVTAAVENDTARFAVYDSVTQLLVSAAQQGPILLVLEDLHWADTSSLILLQLLAGAIQQAPLMVIATYRERELSADHPLRTQLAEFVRRGETIEIPVQGLAEEDVASLVRAQTAFEAEANLVRRLQAHTGGNPLFLKELMRLFGDEDSSKAPTSSDAVPRGVAAILRSRIDSVSAECRQMLEVAAVAGNEFELELLEAVMDESHARLLDLCDEGTASGIVASRDRRFAFAHGLFRDTVYTGLSTARRVELHGLIANTLEQRPSAGTGNQAARLAHHFVEAATSDESGRVKASEYAAEAATQALDELAYEEAVRLFELAIAVNPQLEPRQRAELLLALGRARYMAGDIGGALDTADEVSRLGDRLDDAALVARAALIVRGVGGPGLSHRVARLCEEAMRRPIHDQALKVQVLSQLTVALMQTGNAEDEAAAKEASRQAIELARNAVDPDVIFAGLHARQMATSGPDGVDERLELAERTLRLAKDTRRSSLAGWGHTWRLDALVQLGRIDEAEAEIAAQLRLAEELHEPLARWRALQAQSWIALLKGRFAEARTLAEEVLHLGRKGHHAAAEFTYLTHLVVEAVYCGGLEAALQAMEELLRPLPGASSDPVFRSGALALIGRVDEAKVALGTIKAAGFKGFGPSIALLPGMALVVEAIAIVGDREVAEPVYELALPFASLNVSAGASGLYGSVARYLGMLATVLERWEEAASHFEAAVDLEQRMGARPFLARTRIAYAEMLLRRGQDADRRRARQMLDSAVTVSRELGMKPWEERAAKLVSGLAARGIADHPLSSRELEVAKLVAEGLPNRAIAERLHLSERTAESHVKNICDKLGFNSRSQVAAWVARRTQA